MRFHKPESAALHVLAISALAYVLLGALICVFWWSAVLTLTHYYSPRWGALPRYISIPLFIHEKVLWFPAGMALNAVVAYALVREALGRPTPRLFRYAAMALGTLAVTLLILRLSLVAISPVEIVPGTTARYTWEVEIARWLLVTGYLLLPLLGRAAIAMRVSWRVLKWSGAGVVALLIAAWSLSIAQRVCVTAGRGVIALEEGRVVIGWALPADIYQNINFYTGRPRPVYYCGTYVGRASYWAHNTVDFPLWVPILLLGVPVGVKVWRDRRKLPTNHCPQCGYNLTGNISGTCPECGSPVQERKADATGAVLTEKAGQG